jgi:pyruvate,orthophosphate dikinase
VRTADEFRAAKKEIAAIAARAGMTGKYKLRAVIETLDAVKNIEEIAKEADGLSFGTNDLTSESMAGVARNDVVATRKWMVENNHIGLSPFLRLSDPVQRLMQETVARALTANPTINIGCCGHQIAGEPGSIAICHQLGLNSISVPANAEYLLSSRIIAAHAALNFPRGSIRPSTPPLSASPAVGTSITL